jgi:hypothetical protein
MYVTMGLVMGRSEDEIKDGLNPLNGRRFLSYKVGDEWIGPGGQYRAMAQFVTNTSSVLAPGTDRPIEDILKLDLRANPLLAFWHSRGAVAFNIGGGIAEAMGGEFLPYDEVDGPVDLAKHIGTSLLPFAAQSWVDGERNEGAWMNVSKTAMEGGGLRTTPETVSDKKFEVYNELQATGTLDWEPPEGVEVTVDNMHEVLPAKIKQLIGEDQDVKAAESEAPPTDYSAAKEEWEEIKTRLDSEMLDQWYPAMPGADKRKAVQRYRLLRWQFREQTFKEVVAKFDKGEDTDEPIENVFAEMYWNIPMPHDPGTGKPNFDMFEANRNQVLADARERGINVEFFILDKSRRSTDPDVAEKLDAYDRAVAITKPYWEMDRQMAEAQGLLPLYEQYDTMDRTMQAEWLARVPALRRLVGNIRQIRRVYRFQNPEMDRALREWWDFDVMTPDQLRN